ncbi:anti-sigma factor [Pedobacter yulinensis]|uniref:anti-sigma factor n=1 Tax=Pedobacter yulinensis TaxID=2126353 RepID=UPI0013A629BE|nr:anti-sigma factor [Pedobacter yulinensis]
MESGILELYVLGELSHEEAAEVQALAVKHPEIADEIAAIELALEQYAQSNAIEPDTAVGQRIFAEIGPAISLPASPVAAAVPPQHQTVTDPETGNQSARLRRLQFWLAAAVTLLVVSAGALFYTYSELSAARERITGLSLQNQQYTRNATYMLKSNEELRTMLNMNADAGWSAVRLAGTAQAPEARMMVYWHKESKQVMVNNVNLKLPEHDKNHQYQLWALVNGKPVDLGVFDAGKDTSSMMIRMKEIATAQAFAVTLEPAGGSKNPTLERMVVMGAVSI